MGIDDKHGLSAGDIAGCVKQGIVFTAHRSGVQGVRIGIQKLHLGESANIAESFKLEIGCNNVRPQGDAVTIQANVAG